MMQFKIDENLPVECVQRLQAAGYAAETVAAEGLAGQPDAVVFAFCQHEQRVLVTLDRGFGDIRRYPIGSHVGIIVLRPARQDRETCLALVEQLLPLLREQELAGCIWIVEWGRVRVRSARGG
jgi:predicted nuclease of predicted toxin-antitoxin system